MDRFRDAIRETRDFCGTVHGLKARGWTVTRDVSTVTLVKSGGTSGEVLSDLSGLLDVADRASAEGVFGEASLLVLMAKGKQPVVSRQSPVDYLRTFGRELVDTAADAWAGDAEAALSLPGRWTVTVVRDLSSALAAVEPTFTWRVLPGLSAIEALLLQVPVWALGPTWDEGQPTVFLLEDLDKGNTLHLGRSAIVPLAADEDILEAMRALERRTARDWRMPDLPDAAAPEALAPTLRTGSKLAALEHAAWMRCATMSWVALSTKVDLLGAGSAIVLEVFGLQRVAHRVEAKGVSINEYQARKAYGLYEWASAPDAVDQRLAVQQVASLYRDQPPWEKSADVYDAAIAVFATLRRDAVSEVLLARRSARTLALDVANRTTEQVVAAARVAVERAVATLLAIGGVIVAQTTKALTEGQAQDLRVLLAVFLVGLVLWNITVEGPPLSAPLKSLVQDLRAIADLLTDSERKEILRLDALVSARRRAVRIRVLVPAVYLVAALAALMVR